MHDQNKKQKGSSFYTDTTPSCKHVSYSDLTVCTLKYVCGLIIDSFSLFVASKKDDIDPQFIQFMKFRLDELNIKIEQRKTTNIIRI